MDPIQLPLTHQERDYLVTLLGTVLADKHAEARRTEFSSEMRDQLHREQTLLHRLLERLQPTPV